jgi:NADPH-dependent curcumin reductase CurA
MISDYNKPFEKKYGVKGLQVFFEKRLRMQGFIVADLKDKYFKRHQENVQQWLHDGSLQARLATTTSMANAIEGLLGLFEGKNFGKAVLKVAEEG